MMSPTQPQGHLLFALRRILRSLARLLIRIGIRFQEFDAIARQVFVESAIRDCAHHGKPSRERISVLTGLTRAEVNRCVDGEEGVDGTDPTLRPLLVEVLHRWHTTPGYGGPYGIPLELQFDVPTNRCIRSLVALVSPKANPQVILKELLRSGAVLRAGDKRFRAASRTFMMPDPTSPALIETFGMTVSRLSTTLEYNMDRNHAEKRLERRVFADQGLPVEMVPAFESYARAKAADFLLELDNWLASQSKSDANALSPHSQVDTGVNVCLYVEPPATAEAPLTSLVIDT